MPKQEEDPDEEDESPSKSGNYGSTADFDPMVHLVETIVTDKKEPGIPRQYLVKYKGLSYHDCNWISEDDFNNNLSF